MLEKIKLFFNINWLDFLYSYEIFEKILYKKWDINKDIFVEILLKASIENDKKQEFLKNAFPDLNITDKDIYRFFFCNYLPNNEKDLLKRPLSKAVYDLYKELTQTS